MSVEIATPAADNRRLFDGMKRYAVVAADVADFYRRFRRPDRFSGRGMAYVEGIIRDGEAEYEANGYAAISSFGSATGSTVTFYGANLGKSYGEWLAGKNMQAQR